ncbi:hypothetical protein NADFUDRAFT_47114 [Nadsonia fulvescens var. elongata DSM 6958]|uniref:Mediator of RNA polymerase II transcription subunit 1 n=1 Tax=Nadsonia fulvescens var. elongata DSM 6958 TaxID=857566 RepID=A0A1E3PJ73_9ASCO|nr:hypothetical protein NADFUDRAFT_47114 [Nadsonia fulvescens var. elongata DSM 6958]
MKRLTIGGNFFVIDIDIESESLPNAKENLNEQVINVTLAIAVDTSNTEKTIVLTNAPNPIDLATSKYSFSSSSTSPLANEVILAALTSVQRLDRFSEILAFLSNLDKLKSDRNQVDETIPVSSVAPQRQKSIVGMGNDTTETKDASETKTTIYKPVNTYKALFEVNKTLIGIYDKYTESLGMSWDESNTMNNDTNMDYLKGLLRLSNKHWGVPRLNTDGRLGLSIWYWTKQSALNERLFAIPDQVKEAMMRLEKFHVHWSLRPCSNPNSPFAVKEGDHFNLTGFIVNPITGNVDGWNENFSEDEKYNIKAEWVLRLNPGVWLPMNILRNNDIDNNNIVANTASGVTESTSPGGRGRGSVPLDSLSFASVKAFTVANNSHGENEDLEYYHTKYTNFCLYPLVHTRELAIGHPRELFQTLNDLRKMVLLETLVASVCISRRDATEMEIDEYLRDIGTAMPSHENGDDEPWVVVNGKGSLDCMPEDMDLEDMDIEIEELIRDGVLAEENKFAKSELPGEATVCEEDEETKTSRKCVLNVSLLAVLPVPKLRVNMSGLNSISVAFSILIDQHEKTNEIMIRVIDIDDSLSPQNVKRMERMLMVGENLSMVSEWALLQVS